jgi:hypothetical protein
LARIRDKLQAWCGGDVDVRVCIEKKKEEEKGRREENISTVSSPNENCVCTGDAGDMQKRRRREENAHSALSVGRKKTSRPPGLSIVKAKVTSVEITSDISHPVEGGI